MSVKTIAIRLDEVLWSRFTALAAFEGRPASEAVRDALSEYVAAHSAQYAEKAQAALAQIDEEAIARKQAILDLFPGTPPVRPRQA